MAAPTTANTETSIAMEDRQFTGIIPPIVTPFDHHEDIDHGALAREIEYQLSCGVDGVCVTGTTGEGQTLSAEEVAEVTRVAVDVVPDDKVVLSGVIQNSTRGCIRYGQAAAQAGASGLQVTPVHYLFQPGHEQLIGHYKRVAQATQKPVVVYNVVPWAMVEPATLVALLEQEPLVAGIKQSGGDLHKLADLLAAAPPRATISSAIDDLLYPSFALGAHGSISGTSSLLPDLVVELWEVVAKNEHERALQLHCQMLPVWRAVEHTNMPALIKEALRLQGRHVGAARGPCDAVSDEQRAALVASLDLIDKLA